MESAPQHHREGMQEQLDKAYDEGHHDNEAINNAEAAIGSYKREIAEITGIAEKEREAANPTELEPVLARLREKGYLDTSFEGKEVHELEIQPLSKEEALELFHSRVGAIGGYDYEDIEKDMPYTTPKSGRL